MVRQRTAAEGVNYFNNCRDNSRRPRRVHFLVRRPGHQSTLLLHSTTPSTLQIENMEPNEGAIKTTRLKRVRGGHRAAFTRLTTKVDQFVTTSITTDDQLCEAEALLSSLKSKVQDIHRWDTEIQLGIDDENELDTDVQAATNFEMDSSITIARLTALIDNYKRQPLPSRRSSSPTVPGSRLRLPKLELPSFSGSYTDWTSFQDLFNAAVDSNAQLSDSEKLNYLRACVKGDAAKLISSISITDANYSIAMRLLAERYDNKRSIVQAHLKAIWSQSAIKTESASGLRKLLETTNENLRALKELGQPVDHWDSLLVFWSGEKMDVESRKQWELVNPGTELLTWEKLSKFLDTRSRALETSAVKAVPHASQPQQLREKRAQVYAASALCDQDCSEEHKLHACPQFKQMSMSERLNCAKTKKVCFNCLQPGHSANNCPSKFTCRECKQRHHTLLHRSTPSSQGSKDKATGLHGSLPDSVPEESSTTTDPLTSGHCNASAPTKSVLLSTALVSIKDHAGKSVKLRALLDSGSQASFITESMATALMLRLRKGQVEITTLGASTTEKTKGMIVTKLNDAVPINLHVISRITNQVPTSKVDISQMRNIRNLKLADPTFNTPGKIDVLLGADVLEDVMMENKIKDNGLSVRDSIFGWVVSGPVKQTSESTLTSHHASIGPSSDNDQSLTRFWELENVPEKRHLSSEEKQCEQHFDSTTTRKEDGRFIVEMPFKEDCSQLGHSKASAMRRFLNLEKKLVHDPSLHERYSAFVKEFIDLGHLEKVPTKELENPRHFYLPHHCVLKEGSSTTKLRVVFDASAKTSSGLSLNDCLLVGPKIQEDLFNILTRFRFFKVAMSADVAKMYRQVELCMRDRDLHRLLWRFKPGEPVDIYRMTRVTYGVASSSYHSIRCLTECANFKDTHQLVQDALRRDFYVDDILTGASSKEEAEILQDGLIATLKKAQFDLRKWTSSDPELVLRLPPEFREANEELKFLDENHTIKTLGIVWNPSSDKFIFTVSHLSNNFDKETPTKRRMLSDIAKIFDPLGWLTPVTLQLKHLMQQVWQAQLGWDQQLPIELTTAYLDWRKKLVALKNIQLQRFCLSKEQHDRVTLHVFCDASEKGYAACVYVVAKDLDGGRSSTLLAAKSKVAPLKVQSIPRLELCAALLGQRLLASVVQGLSKIQLHIADKYAWSDSTIVLSWLQQEASHWSTFVANRVAEIQQDTDLHWNHVSTHENPADVASRGLCPSLLKEYSLWWQGPDWLITGIMPEPLLPSITTEEKKKTATSAAKPAHVLAVEATSTRTSSKDIIDLSRQSSFTKAIRVSAYVRRFIARLKDKTITFPLYITTEESSNALMTLLRQEQAKFFEEEIDTLQNDVQVKKSSRLLKLYPFLHEGVLCVGGRLVHAKLPDEAKYPRLVPQESHLADLIVRNSHRLTLHGGTNQVMAHIRQRFWIPACRNLVRKTLMNCVTCSRFTSKPSYPLMGDLPKQRVDIPKRAFQDVGLDFAGPFLCKGPNRSTVKAYLAIFVCFASKAVHLEAVSDLTSQACIAALRRFVSRRGCPETIYSDNGSNFVGAQSEILALQELLRNQHEDSLQAAAAGLQLKWNFIPPRAPHFGGLWEAAVKSAKKHLRRTMGNSVLTYEELSTLFCQIENVLNSRPIGTVSEDPKDETSITPADLCGGSKLDLLPSHSASTPTNIDSCSPSKRWTYIQNLLNGFWKRWSKEYVSSLQERGKWASEKENLKLGDIVYITDDNTPPLQWPIGRVVYVYSGPDKFVRVVKVKTTTGIYNRAVHKLRKMPVSE